MVDTCFKCEQKFEEKDLQESHDVPQDTKKQICAFCGEEIKVNLGKLYHLDCFDTEVEKLYGMNACLKLMSIKDHLICHDFARCPICTPRKSKGTMWLIKTIKDGTSQGNRFDLRWRIFITMKFLGWNPEQIIKGIQEFNSHCTPPEKENVVNYHIAYLLKRYIL